MTTETGPKICDIFTIWGAQFLEQIFKFLVIKSPSGIYLSDFFISAAFFIILKHIQ